MRAVTVEPVEGTDERGRPRRPGPEQLRITEVEAPTPAPGEILVTTVAAGINRADLLQRQGLYPPPKGISDVIGLEAAGTVAALGEGVTEWAVGDELVALLAGGGYAEQFVVPAGQAMRPPAGMDLVTAATVVEVATTVASNMRHVHLREGETFLVHGGAGGIGSFAIQYAKAKGCRVATTAGTAEKLEFCRSLGADIAIDYHDDWVSELKQATDGHGADVILDIMGAKYLPLNVTALARDGRCVIIGMQGGAKGELNIGELLGKRGTVTATSLRFRPVEQKIEICRMVAAEVWPLYETGTIVPAPVERFAFDDVASAHARLESGEVTGKLVLTF
ncbi:NAD(P)H-quinone oxidoreductase [Aestuariimicrobium ganziense]|uniref:NAD(P)H-quinone oxidoreductase n=1 Tax=Aestuariimicrobium ganziense TaxID=2773677 RepID=UPI0019451F97|nr:NAD(P)H-quinone oxidoreductase [Aestuariimicrobium ganziense]